MKETKDVLERLSAIRDELMATTTQEKYKELGGYLDYLNEIIVVKDKNYKTEKTQFDDISNEKRLELRASEGITSDDKCKKVVQHLLKDDMYELSLQKIEIDSLYSRYDSLHNFWKTIDKDLYLLDREYTRTKG